MCFRVVKATNHEGTASILAFNVFCFVYLLVFLLFFLWVTYTHPFNFFYLNL